MMRAVTVGIYTLGCRVNQYESDALCREFANLGWTVLPPDEVCDIYIVNTCTVTAESDRKSRQLIRRCRRQNPDCFVLVCGCFSQISPQEASRDADFVCGTRNKALVVSAARSLVTGVPVEKINISDPSSLPYEAIASPLTERTRAFIKIEDGCPGRCSYCAIRLARGDVVSRPRDEIINEMKAAVKAGFREVVLTGIETSAYGTDTGDSLISLIEEVGRQDGIDRIRLGSVDPAWLTPDVSRRLSQTKKLMPHFHLSVQSASSVILAAMRRKYNAEMLYRSVNGARDSIQNVRFSADFIVGFPGETDGDFEKTVEFVSFLKPVHAHVFPFSARRGTDAAEMKGQLPADIKARRASLLSETAEKSADDEAKKYIGKRAEVLFETYSDGFMTGHMRDFSTVTVKTDSDLGNEIKDIILTGYTDNIFKGELL